MVVVVNVFDQVAIIELIVVITCEINEIVINTVWSQSAIPVMIVDIMVLYQCQVGVGLVGVVMVGNVI